MEKRLECEPSMLKSSSTQVQKRMGSDMVLLEAFLMLILLIGLVIS
jgi:hypothetical protein